MKQTRLFFYKLLTTLVFYYCWICEVGTKVGIINNSFDPVSLLQYRLLLQSGGGSPTISL